MLNMEQKPFLVYDVSTIFVTHLLCVTVSGNSKCFITNTLDKTIQDQVI